MSEHRDRVEWTTIDAKSYWARIPWARLHTYQAVRRFGLPMPTDEGDCPVEYGWIVDGYKQATVYRLSKAQIDAMMTVTRAAEQLDLGKALRDPLRAIRRGLRDFLVDAGLKPPHFKIDVPDTSRTLHNVIYQLRTGHRLSNQNRPVM